MRRAATWVPYGDFWVPMLEGRLRPAQDWRDIAGKSYGPRDFLADLRPTSPTLLAIADALQEWAVGEGNCHPDTHWEALAAQLQNDAADALAEVDA